MPIPGTTGCFLCNGMDHWADSCETRQPPKDRKDHEARIALYVEWCIEALPDLPRITPRMKTLLIENENRMWAAMQPKRERKAS